MAAKLHKMPSSVVLVLFLDGSKPYRSATANQLSPNLIPFKTNEHRFDFICYLTYLSRRLETLVRHYTCFISHNVCLFILSPCEDIPYFVCARTFYVNTLAESIVDTQLTERNCNMQLFVYIYSLLYFHKKRKKKKERETCLVFSAYYARAHTYTHALH